MKCVICKKADTVRGTTTVTFERNGTTVVFKLVPASVCPNCGEEYVDDQTAAKLLETADGAADNGVQIDVRKYTVAA